MLYLFVLSHLGSQSLMDCCYLKAEPIIIIIIIIILYQLVQSLLGSQSNSDCCYLKAGLQPPFSTSWSIPYRGEVACVPQWPGAISLRNPTLTGVVSLKVEVRLKWTIYSIAFKYRLGYYLKARPEVSAFVFIDIITDQTSEQCIMNYKLLHYDYFSMHNLNHSHFVSTGSTCNSAWIVVL